MELGDATIKVKACRSSLHSQAIIIDQVRIRKARLSIIQHCIVTQHHMNCKDKVLLPLA